MKRLRTLSLLSLFCLALAAPSAAFAAEDSAADDAPSGYFEGTEDADKAEAPEGYLPASSKNTAATEQDKADGFVAADRSSQADTVDGGKLMLLAYAGFWLIALIYITTLAQRARRTGKEVVELHRQLKELDDRIEDLETRGA